MAMARVLACLLYVPMYMPRSLAAGAAWPL